MNNFKKSLFDDFFSQKYKDLFNTVKYLLPFFNKNTIPILCAYSGKDETIDIGHYTYLIKNRGK